ncbi:conserved protein of unknown function [Pseudodesulfovibrio profundus]|uniref:Uncharacterized protein n=1 Tax=Pseudodesulfovibrio profundus TaxID=57320 RepID=A0A2C8FDP8_9BACT|nr:hypothetical protein [Pseudodesulfovibrio profundus]SOB60627.1 conserved protein of unknown function [Pseudodesulfovibrio profundus]
MTKPNEHTDACWQLDRKVSLAVVIIFLVQFAGTVWWASDLSARLLSVETEQARYEHIMQQITEIKTDVKWIKQAVDK